MTVQPSALSLGEAMAQAVGRENCLTERDQLAPYERTTFATDITVALVVKPDSREQVQEVVRIARAYKSPLYSLSRGCNWGLGSRVPGQDQAVVVDLSRMNRIVSCNQDSAYIEIEPGVTFAQVSTYLREQNGGLFLSTIGGHPDSSIIGNTLERGDGLGPLGDRSHYVCGLEVVLGDGRFITTGLENFSNSTITQCTNDPVGPSLDGLFFQSNFGIITGMTIWLKRLSPQFASGLLTFASTKQLVRALPAIRLLQEQGVIQGNCLALWNIHKILAATTQHPLQQSLTANQRAACITDESIDQYLPSGLKRVRWLVTLALYAPDRQHMRAHCRIVRKLLKPHTLKTVLITNRVAWIGKFFSKPISWILRFDIRRWLDAFYFRSVFQGYTSDLSIRSLYWRKPGEIPKAIDPDADRCGLLWLCHLIPTTAEGVEKANQIISHLCRASGFEPNLACLNTSERLFRLFIAIMYDRDLAGEDQRALECQGKIEHALNQAGFPPFRLGLQSMGSIAPQDSTYADVLAKLKKLFDPDNIIAPGRYDFTTHHAAHSNK